MARKSRKVKLDAPAPIVTPIAYKTAVYARLSIEDTRNSDGNSIENQILMVKNYIENHSELTLCNVFSDNGMTGTNFNRPGFESLMQEIRRGSINCIVVKDLSRFGRDYIEAGNFLEVIFPRLGIRFISISDNYDSFDPRCQGEGMFIALKNIIHTSYAKDISVKIRTAYKTKCEKGEPVVQTAPFGYLKSPENKHQLIIDDEAADIVRMIFKLKLQGLSVYQITSQLTLQSIVTPKYYQYIKNATGNKMCESSQIWAESTVTSILRNVTYVENVVMGKTRMINGKQCKVPEKDWTIIKNTHEPIISQTDFDSVAELLKQQRKKYNAKSNCKHSSLPENILKGFIFCKECGRSCKRTSKRTDKASKDNTYYLAYTCRYCSRYILKNTRKSFSQKELYDTIYNVVRLQMDVFAGQYERFLKSIESSESKNYRNELITHLKTTQKELDAIPAKKLRLYDDYYAEIVDEENYILFNQIYDAQKIELSQKLKELSDEISTLQPEHLSNYESISVINNLDNQKELSKEMLTALVERIEISHSREIEVIFRYKNELSNLTELNDEREVHLHG